MAARLPRTQSTFLAPASRCCRRLRRRSSSRTRGTACGGGRDLGSSDAARLRLAALGRGGGGAPASRPPAGPGGGWGRFRRWPCPRPAAGRCQERRGSSRCRVVAGLARGGAGSPRAHGEEKPGAGGPGTRLGLGREWRSLGDPGGRRASQTRPRCRQAFEAGAHAASETT